MGGQPKHPTGSTGPLAPGRAGNVGSAEYAACQNLVSHGNSIDLSTVVLIPGLGIRTIPIAASRVVKAIAIPKGG